MTPAIRATGPSRVREQFLYCEKSGHQFPVSALRWGDEEISHELAIYDNQDGTTPVGKYPPNGYGLCDTVDKAWEWVADYYDAKILFPLASA